MALQTFNPTGLARDPSLQTAMGKELDNAFKRVQNKYAEPTAQADIAYKEAQTKKAQMGGDWSGTYQNLAKLHNLKQNPNADPELIKTLQRQADLERDREEGILNYQNQVAKTMQYRSAPPNVKLMMNIDMLAKNKTFDMEGNEVPLTPQQGLQRQNILAKEIMNNTTDQPTRQRLEMATNFGTTLENIDPKKAFALSGGAGGMKKLLQKGKGALGLEQSREYRDFQNNLQRLKVGSHQLSQFFDLSSAQKIQEAVEKLLDANAWFKNPETAMEQYNTAVDLFRKEHANMMKSVNMPSNYGFNFQAAGASQQQDPAMYEQAAQQMQGGGDTVVRYLDGHKLNIPAHLVAQFDAEHN